MWGFRRSMKQHFLLEDNNWALQIDTPMIGLYVEVISCPWKLRFYRNTKHTGPLKFSSTQTHLKSVLFYCEKGLSKCGRLKIVVYNWKPNSFLIIGMLQWHSIIRDSQQLWSESGFIIHSIQGCIWVSQQKTLEDKDTGSFSSHLLMVTRLPFTYTLQQNKENIVHVFLLITTDGIYSF